MYFIHFHWFCRYFETLHAKSLHNLRGKFFPNHSFKFIPYISTRIGRIFEYLTALSLCLSSALPFAQLAWTMIIDSHHFTMLKLLENLKNSNFGPIIGSHHFTVLKLLENLKNSNFGPIIGGNQTKSQWKHIALHFPFHKGGLVKAIKFCGTVHQWFLYFACFFDKFHYA